MRTYSPASIWPLALALTLRLAAWLMVSPDRFASDEDSYFAAATSLVARGQQDLFWPPVTGWLIAGARAILQTDRAVFVRLIWIAFDLGCLVALWTLAIRLGRALFSGDPSRAERLAMLATLGYALYLPAISHAQFATSETPALLQTLLVLVLLTRSSPTAASSATAGGLTGTLILTRPSLLPLLLLWPAAIGRSDRTNGWSLRLTAFVAAGCLVVGGWVVRNWQRTGQITIANNSAYNLYIGNRDVYSEDLDLFSPIATAEQIEFRRQQWSGRLVYPSDSPAELQRQAIAWIRAHPMSFVRRALGRLARVFAPKTDVLELGGGEQRVGIFSPASLALLSAANAQWTVVLFGGLLGLAGLRRLTRDLARLFDATIIGSVLLCLVAISKPRYSFVFDPVLLLGLAAVLTAPAKLTAAIDRRKWRHFGLFVAFLMWGWAAWIVFAISSRMASRSIGRTSTAFVPWP